MATKAKKTPAKRSMLATVLVGVLVTPIAFLFGLLVTIVTWLFIRLSIVALQLGLIVGLITLLLWLSSLNGYPLTGR